MEMITAIIEISSMTNYVLSPASIFCLVLVSFIAAPISAIGFFRTLRKDVNDVTILQGVTLFGTFFISLDFAVFFLTVYSSLL